MKNSFLSELMWLLFVGAHQGAVSFLYNAVYFIQPVSLHGLITVISFSSLPLGVFDIREPHWLVPQGKLLYISDIKCSAWDERGSPEVDLKSLLVIFCWLLILHSSFLLWLLCDTQ